MSLTYTLLLRDVLVAIEAAGLEANLGFLHESGPAKPALALDLMEEFRPLVADSLILELANRHLLGLEQDHGNSSVLSPRPRRRLFSLYESRLHRARRAWNGQRMSYRRCIVLQAEQLAAVLAGKRSAYQPLRWA